MDKYKVNIISEEIDEETGLRKIRINIVNASGEAIETVDVLTSSDSVLFENGNTLDEELVERFIYNNSLPTGAALGGIPKGSVFVNVEYKKLFDMLLYGTKNTTIELEPSKPPGFYIVGETISPLTIGIHIDKGSVGINTIRIKKDNVVVRELDPSLLTAAGYIEYTYTDPLFSSCVFSVTVVDTNNLEYNSDPLIYKFNAPIYYGTAFASAVITEELIEGLRYTINYNELEDESITVVDESLTLSNQRLIVAKLRDWDSIDMYDWNGLKVNEAFEGPIGQVINFNNGVSMMYDCYRSDVTSQNNIDMTYRVKF